MFPRLCVVVPAVGLAIWVSAQQPRIDLFREVEVGSSSPTIPSWSGGALVQVDDHYSSSPSIHVFDPVGGRGEDVVLPVKIPGATLIDVEGAARGQDGTIVHCGWARDGTGRLGAYLAIVSPGGLSEKLIRTEPYEPVSVIVAPDGTV